MSEKKIERSLERLQYFFENPKTPLSELIPAFYYSADLLMKCAIDNDDWKKTDGYYIKFNEFMDKFIERDLSKMKIHEKEILDQILQIINDSRFLQRINGQPRSTIRKSFLTNAAERDSRSQLSLSSYVWSEISQQHQIKDSKISRSELSRRSRKNHSVIKQKQSKDQHQHQSLIHRIQQVYADHQIDEAEEIRKQIISKKLNVSKEIGQLMNKIQFQYKRMIDFHSQFSRQGWIFEKQKNGVRIFSKIDEGDPIAGVKMQGQFQIPVQNFLAIISQADLFQQFVPFCHESEQLHRIGRNQIIGRSLISIPFMKNRGMLFYSVGYDRMKTNGTIFIYSCTITQTQSKDMYGFQAKRNPNEVNLDYKYFIVEYSPISINRAKVRIASKVDMNMKHIPKFILKASALKFGYDYFDNIRKINANFRGSAWQQKMLINPALYEFFMDKIAQYLDVEKKEGTSESLQKHKIK